MVFAIVLLKSYVFPWSWARTTEGLKAVDVGIFIIGVAPQAGMDDIVSEDMPRAKEAHPISVHIDCIVAVCPNIWMALYGAVNIIALNQVIRAIDINANIFIEVQPVVSNRV